MVNLLWKKCGKIEVNKSCLGQMTVILSNKLECPDLVNMNAKEFRQKCQSILKQSQIFLSDTVAKKEMSVEKKLDGSDVTVVDLKISEIIEAEFDELLQNNSFYCEEKHPPSLKFPALIVDPIDGTSALKHHRAECAISIAYMESPSLLEASQLAFVANPFTSYMQCSGDMFIPSEVDVEASSLSIFVSRSDLRTSKFDSFIGREDFSLIGRSSIAFKLGLLASGACDAVVSLTPKNIWDIAAGTLLCAQQRIFLYNKKGQVDNLDAAKLNGPMIWTRSEYADRLGQVFF